VAGDAVIDRYDVLGLGILAVDDLFYVDAYPAPDAKVRIRRRLRQCGGQTGTALVAAARLGARCAYAGAIGNDDLSEFVRGALERETIDFSIAATTPEGRPFHSTIVVDETAHTRTIFYEMGGFLGEETAWPPREMIRSSRVLFVDQFESGRMIRAARIAREAGIPIVADIESDASPRFQEFLSLIDHLVVSDAFTSKLTGECDPAAAVRALWAPGRAAVVVTCGADGAWFLENANDQPRHQPAFPVDVLDTTGCGDVFHGAYAAELARGSAIAERVRIASAAASLKAAKAGGQAGIPTRDVLEAFLKRC
jgi:sugar/nucleoside kinase (ribokinase family)